MLVILWDAAIVPIATYGQIILASFLVIGLVVVFSYTLMTLIRIIIKIICIVWTVMFGSAAFSRDIIELLEIKPQPTQHKPWLIKLIKFLIDKINGK